MIYVLLKYIYTNGLVWLLNLLMPKKLKKRKNLFKNKVFVLDNVMKYSGMFIILQLHCKTCVKYND